MTQRSLDALMLASLIAAGLYCAIAGLAVML